MCIDKDECADGTAACNKTTQECINLSGGYHCICKWGYAWTGSECIPNVALAEGLARMMAEYDEHKADEDTRKRSQWFSYLYNTTIGRFFK